MRNILICAMMALAQAAAAAGTGCVYDLRGDVSLRQPGGDWQKARKGSPVEEGTGLRTGAGAWCELLFKDGTFIKLEEGSEAAALTLKADAESRVFDFSFLRGKALWMAAKVKKALSKFTVRTPAAVCAVRGTDFSIQVSTSGEALVGLFDGKVALTNDGGEKELLAGGEAEASPGSLAVQARLSRLMQAEQRRYAKVKGRVERLRARLAAREDFIDDYMNRQRKALDDMDSRRAGKLKGRR